MTIHELKTWPEHFKPLAVGEKTVELRKDDRGFKVGDYLCLCEWNPQTKKYTGNEVLRIVTHIVRGGPWLAEGYCALSLSSNFRYIERF